MREEQPKARALARSVAIAPIIARQLAPLALTIALVAVFWDRFQHIEFKAIWQDLSTVGSGAWALACAAVLASFLAIARYDRIIHGLLGTGITDKDARFSGVVAVAAAQFAGFGLLTGTLARWRMIPGLSLRDALGVTGFVSASFLLGWAGVIVLVQLISGTPLLPDWVEIAVALVGITVLVGPFVPKYWPRRAPSVSAMASIVMTVAVDLGFAGLAFWALLPPDSTLSFAQVMPVFLLATMAGLVGGTPGGIGAFELTLLHFLPSGEHNSLLVAALAFRLVYHAIPGLLAGGFLAIGPRNPGRGRQPMNANVQHLKRPNGGFAEAGLTALGEFAPHISNNGTRWISAERPNALIALTRPVAGSARDMLTAHRQMAARKSKAALVYRADPRTACAARALGWRVVQFGHEPIIDTRSWHLDRPNMRQLRRQLRHAANGGVVVQAAGDTLPLDQMAKVSQAWAKDHGGERGFCMGHFDRAYVAGQRIWLAYQGPDLVGFVTFHQAHGEWTLDLMRHVSDAPCGTMHALIAAALADAKAHGVPRVSLAATLGVPPRMGHGLTQHAIAQCAARFGSSGLVRFKSSFAPVWVPRFVVAPGVVAMILGLFDLFAATAPRDRSQPCRGFIKFYS